jgi:hypothetical protein
MGAIADRVVRGRFSVVRRVAPALTLAGLIVGSTAVLTPSVGAASAGSPVGSVSVKVDRDYFGDGTYHAPSAGQAGDPAQPGMDVTATDINGKTAQKITDAAGAVTISAADGLTPPYRIDVSIPAPYSSYYFGGPASTYQLTPGAQYTVEFDVSTVNNLPSGVTVPSLRYTTSKAGGDSRHDSNTPAVSTPTADATVTAPTAPGGVDHTIDAGVYSLNIPVPPTTTAGSGGRSPHAPHSSDSGPSSGGTGGTGGTSSPSADINTGGPADPSGPNPWLITGGIAAIAAAGLTTGMAMRRSRIPRS